MTYLASLYILGSLPLNHGRVAYPAQPSRYFLVVTYIRNLLLLKNPKTAGFPTVFGLSVFNSLVSNDGMILSGLTALIG